MIYDPIKLTLKHDQVNELFQTFEILKFKTIAIIIPFQLNFSIQFYKRTVNMEFKIFKGKFKWENSLIGLMNFDWITK